MPELVALARTELNSWSFKNRKLLVTRGAPGKEFYAVYDLMGKYADAGVVSNIAAVFMLCLIFLAEDGTVPAESILLAVGLLFIAFGLRAYKEVSVSFADEKVWLKDENLVVNAIAFSDIEKIEKGHIRLKVVARDGRTIYLPRALYLAAELLAGFSGAKIV